MAMQVPLEIAFHNLQSSDWAEQEIRKHVDKLERRFDRITSCRVRVDQRAKSQPSSIPPVVHIEIGIPGHRDVIVSHEPEHLQRRYQDPDIRDAITEAFGIAERQLTALKEQMQRRTKDVHHDDQHQFLGQVAEMHPKADHGFLLNKEGGLLYFHRNSLLSGDFDKLSRGDELHYVEDVGDTGPIAIKVRVKVRS